MRRFFKGNEEILIALIGVLLAFTNDLYQELEPIPKWLPDIIIIKIILIIFIVYLTFKSIQGKKAKNTKLKIAKLEDILEKCVQAVEELQNRKENKTLRANIMVPRGKQLEILASCRMGTDPDRDISFAIGQGCCGDAFDSHATATGDLQKIYRDNWDRTRMDYGSSPWGITRDHYEKTRDIKAVISIPIEYRKKVIGVLNFDDKVNLEETHFKDDHLLITIGGYMCFIIDVMMQEEF